MSTPVLTDTWQSIIRVVAAAAGGFGVTQLARLGVTIDSTLVEGLVTAVATSVYYAVGRFLESNFPKAAWLLVIRKIEGK